MKKNRKTKRQTAHLAVLMLLSVCLLGGCQKEKSAARALERLEAYAAAVDEDYETPESIYAFLTADIKTQISEEDFVCAFEKERTYPYLTPLYIYDPVFSLSADGTSGEATYTQAARLSGMTHTVRLVYENGDYYIEDWQELADGSYLEKFADIPYSLDWYYDTDAIGKP